MNKLTRVEEETLASAEDDGLIHFPQGTVRGIEMTFQILEGLARRGFVHYVDKTGYRAFWLTPNGMRLASTLRLVRDTKWACAA